MARSRSNETVSLFPFLAVLVCAMGALIFLLLVITRQIRSQAKADAAVIEVAPPDESQSESTPFVDLAARDTARAANRSLSTLLPTPKPSLALAPPFQARLIPAQPTLAPRDVITAVNTEKKQDPDAKLIVRLTALTRELEQQSRSVKQTGEKLAGVLSQAQLLQDQLKSAEAKLAALQARKQKVEAGAVDASSEITALESQIARTEKELERARKRLVAQSTKYTFVAFDGQNGTVRRPIVIECTPNGYTFVQERISLEQSDFAGFTAQVNPLTAGTMALLDYWSSQAKRNGKTDKDSQPYILLIVRPGSAAGYYAARKMLEPLKTSFGYELFDTKQELHAPPTDTEAKTQCQNAITKLMAMRDELRQRVLAGRVAAGDGGGGGGDGFGRVPRGQIGNGEIANGAFENGQFANGETANGQTENGQTANGENRGAFGEAGSGQNKPNDNPNPFARNPNLTNPDEAGPVPREFELPIGGGIPSAGELGSREPPTSLGGTSQLKDLSPQPSTQPPNPSQKEESLFPNFEKDLDQISKRTGGQQSGRPSTFRRDYRGRRRGSIGWERPLSIKVETDRILIGKRYEVSLANDPSQEELIGQVMEAIDRVASSWPDPPNDRFYNVPKAKFILPPGARANQIYESLAVALKRAGIPYSTSLAP